MKKQLVKLFMAFSLVFVLTTPPETNVQIGEAISHGLGYEDGSAGAFAVGVASSYVFGQIGAAGGFAAGGPVGSFFGGLAGSIGGAL